MRRVSARHVSLLAVFATAMAAALQISSAAGASPQVSWVCERAACDSLSTLGGVMSTARSDEAREPSP